MNSNSLNEMVQKNEILDEFKTMAMGNQMNSNVINQNLGAKQFSFYRIICRKAFNLAEFIYKVREFR